MWDFLHAVATRRGRGGGTPAGSAYMANLLVRAAPVVLQDVVLLRACRNDELLGDWLQRGQTEGEERKTWSAIKVLYATVARPASRAAIWAREGVRPIPESR